MKIAQIACTFPPYRGGIGNVAYNFSVGLSKLGHQITVFTPDYGNQGQREDFCFRVERIKPLVKRGNAALLAGLSGRLKNFDLIHFHYPFFGASEVFWWENFIKRLRVPFFLHYHMDVFGLPFFIRPFAWPAKICFSSLVRQSAGVSCASLDYIRHSEVKQVYEKMPEKFLEIPFGVDTERFFEKKGGVDKQAPLILFVGALDRAHDFKGLGLLFRSLSKIRDRDWSLLVAGGGDMLSEYAALAKRLGLAGRVRFLGRVSDEQLPSIYRQADFFVFPSVARNEAFGLVLLEAMASGLPILACDLPGVRTVFEAGRHGRKFKTGDQADLVAGLEFFLDHPEKIRGWGKSARLYTLEKYQWSKAAEKLSAVFSAKQL